MIDDAWERAFETYEGGPEHICDGHRCDHGVCLCQICDACDEFNRRLLSEGEDND